MSVIVFAVVDHPAHAARRSGTTCSRCKVALVPIVCSHRRGGLAARHAGAARLRHRPARHSWCRSSSSRSACQPRRAEDQRRQGSRGARASTAWTPRASTFRQLLMPAIIALLADLVGLHHDPADPGAGRPGNGGHRQHRRRHRDPHRPHPAAGAGVLGALGRRATARASSAARRSSPRTGRGLARITERRPAAVIIGIALLLGVFGVVEGPRDADRRHAGGRARAARRLALQPRQQHHHARSSRSASTSSMSSSRRRSRPAPSYELMTRHRPLRLAHAQCRRRAGSDVAAHRRQDRDRRLERGQPQVAQHAARAQPADAVHALHRDQHRAAQRATAT